MNWLSNNIANIVVSMLVAALLFVCIKSIFFNKKATGCGCNCSSCSRGCMCSAKQNKGQV